MTDHYSPTQTNMFYGCGCSYEFRYIQGMKIAPSFAMVKGGSVHKSAEVNYKQKITSKIDMPVDDVLDAAGQYFDDNIQDCAKDLYDDRPVKVMRGEEKDNTIEIAKFHRKEYAPTIQPLYCELKQEITIPSIEKTLLGYIDLVDDQEVIEDMKVSGRSRTQQEVDTDLQLTLYSMVYHALKGKPSNGVRLSRFYRTPKTKKSKKVIIESSRDEKDYQVAINKILKMDEAIKKGIFMPAAPGSWKCSPRFCGYWYICKYGGK